MNRDKTVIGRVALSLAVVTLIFALGSCTQEPIRLSMPGGDGVEVRVTLPSSVATRATTGGTEVGTNDENRLDRVTILVFNEGGTKLEAVLSEDVTASNTSLATSQPKWALEGTLLVSPIENPLSPKKIYAIANWDKRASDFDKTTYNETMLKAELTTIAAVADINGNKAYPMLMSGSKAVAKLASVHYNVTVEMERQVSKIKTVFTIPVDVQNRHAQIEWQTEQMKITVVNVPNQSYVVGRGAVPTGRTLLNSAAIAVDDTQPAAGDKEAVPATTALKWSESLYINENPVVGTTEASKADCTCIVVQLPYKNRITNVVEMDNYYQLYINDTRDAASPHKVVRNTIYTLNVQILGMGLPFNKLVPDANVDNQLTVNSWEKGEMVDVETPSTYYFNIDRTNLGFQYFEASFQSNIATDVADWKLVKEDGTTLFSFAEEITADATIDGVTYTLAGNAANATITVGKPAGSVNFTTYQMTFIAKNLKVPFTVAYDNGFIPNSVLTAGGSYGVWPANNLPSHGLQIAKRGTSGVAGADDPVMKWQKSEIFTGGTAAGLGFGASSTDAIVDTEHPAAQYCRDMGDGWFLPSQDELKLIYDNRSALGASYTFSANYYWSATEYNSHNTWPLNFGGYTPVNNKGNNLRVRCVKYI